MGFDEYAEDIAWRETRAVELVGPYAVKTAGAYVGPDRLVVDGVIYAGRDAFCFFADDPRLLAIAQPVGQIDARTLVIAYRDCPEPTVQAPPVAPNASVSFGVGRNFVGVKNRVQELVRLWYMSASSDPGASGGWDERYMSLGKPLHSGGFGMSGRAKNWTAFISGLLVAVFVLGQAISGTSPTLVSVVGAPIGLWMLVSFAVRLVLLAVPRYGWGNR